MRKINPSPNNAGHLSSGKGRDLLPERSDRHLVFPTDSSFKMEVRVIGQKESVNPDELDDLDDADDKPQEKKAVAEEIEDDFGV